MKLVTKAVAFALTLALPLAALATVETYTDETTFLDTAGMLTLESFENEVATNSFTSDTFTLTDFTVTGTYSPTCLGIWNEPFVGGFATDGANWLGYQASDNETLTFVFTDPINAFGLNITDWGDFGNGELTFGNEVGDLFTVAVTPLPNGNQLFFGVINDVLYWTTVTLNQTIAGEFYGVDEIYYGGTDVIPVELATWGEVKNLFAD